MNSRAPELRELQQSFLRYIDGADKTLASFVASTAAANAQARLAVYTSGYAARLTDALKETFPGVLALVGDDHFATLARSFINTYPSTFSNLRWYGSTLPLFLGSQAPWLNQPWIAEMAAFEWEMGLAFDASDTASIAFEQLAAQAEQLPALAFSFHPSLRRLPLTWNVADAWKAINQSEAPPALKPLEARTTWAIWRQAFATYYRPLFTDEAAALDAAIRGETFTSMCAGLYEWHDDLAAAGRAAALLAEWVNSTWVTGWQPV